MLRRPRRNRKSPAIRALVRETSLDVAQLIYPLFIIADASAKKEIKSLPGQYQLGRKELLDEIGECMAMGLNSFILFPAVAEELKDKTATYSYANDNFYLEAIRAVKAKYPDCILVSDVALDPYSSEGHDGVVENGRIDNDATLPILAKMSVAQAEAGIDIIGPSDMMDGRVKTIREALDAEGYTDVSIMAYTAKYASAFYGPFRDALESAPKAGDKKTYQMDPANGREALMEALLDEDEGADFLMVKPAVCYLDVICKLKDYSHLPIAAYHVSGEYAMLKAAAANNWIDECKAVEEVLISIKRAGADIILTYFAKEYAARLKSGHAYH